MENIMVKNNGKNGRQMVGKSARKTETFYKKKDI